MKILQNWHRLGSIKNIVASAAIQLASIGCAFLVSLIIARDLGAAAQGIFQTAITWLLLLSTLGRLGLDQLSLRSMAEEKAYDRTRDAHRILARNLKIAAIALSALAFASIFIAPLYGGTMLGSEAVTVLRPVMIAVIPSGLLFVVAEGLRGWQFFNTGAALLYVSVWALLLFELLVAVFLNLMTISLVGWMVLAAHVVTLAVAIVVWIWMLPGPATFLIELNERIYDVAGVVRSAGPLYVNAVAFSLMTSVDIVILSIVASAEELGFYSAVLRTGGIIGSTVVASSFWISPRVALLYARGEHQELNDLLKNYVRTTLAIAPGIGLVFFVFAEQIMSVWGAAYVHASHMLRVYVMFQLCNLVLGIHYYALLVTRAENVQVRSSIAVLVFKVVAVSAGYKLLGIWGALLGTGAALVLLAVAAALLHSRRSRSL